MNAERNILIISDDPGMVGNIVRAVGRLDADYTIFEASSPQEALNVIQSTSIAVAFSEIDMRRMDGLSFIEAHGKEFAGIHWIAISEHKNFYAIQRAIRLGVKDYLLKPFDESGIYGWMQQANAYLPRRERRGACG